jgi:hypothetical protein
LSIVVIGEDMETERGIRLGHSVLADTRDAVADFHRQVAQPDIALVLFFCSSRHDLDALADEMNRRFPGVPVSAAPAPGRSASPATPTAAWSAPVFPAGECTAEVGRIDDLQCFDIDAGHDFAQGVCAASRHGCGRPARQQLRPAADRRPSQRESRWPTRCRTAWGTSG